MASDLVLRRSMLCLRLTSAACVIGAVGAAVLTAGAGTPVSAMLLTAAMTQAGAYGINRLSAKADKAEEQLEREAAELERGLRNADVHRLMGRAITLVLRLRADKGGAGDLAQSMRSLADAVERGWQEIPGRTLPPALREANVSDFFNGAPEEIKAQGVLDAELWRKTLEPIAKQARISFTDAIWGLLGEVLARDYAKALFAVTKSAAMDNDAAWAGLLLRLLAEQRGVMDETLAAARGAVERGEANEAHLVATRKQLAEMATGCATLGDAALAKLEERLKAMEERDEARHGALVALLRSESGEIREGLASLWERAGRTEAEIAGLHAKMDGLGDVLQAIEERLKAIEENTKIAAAAAVDNLDLLRAYGFVPLIAPNIPPLPNTYVERPIPMEKLEAAMWKGGKANVTGRAQASAGGGYGKTVLAYAYALEFRDRYPGGIYKVACEGASIVEALNQLLPDHEGVRQLAPETKASIVRAKLSGGGAALLVLDNVDDVAQWRSYRDSELLPTLPCHLLVTTRTDDIKDVPSVPVDQLEREEAIELLANYRSSARSDGNAGAIETILHETERIAALVAAVGMAMAEDESDDWNGYAAWLKTAQPEELPDAGEWRRNYTDYPHKTAAILDDLRRRLHPAALRALDYAALLPADAIPRGWLEWLVDADAALDGGERKLALENDTRGNPRQGAWYVERLKQRGLLRSASPDGTLWSLHRLHRKRAMDHYRAAPTDEDAAWKVIGACAAARRGAIVGSYPDGRDRGLDDPAALTDQALRWELIPLAMVCRELWKNGHLGAAAWVGVWLSFVLKELGRYSEAAECLPISAETDGIVEDAVGHWVLSACYNNLALIQKELGDFAAARGSIERAIAIDSKHFAPDHLSFGMRYSILGAVQLSQSDLAGARQNMERAIAIQSRYFRPDDPGGAIWMASSYSDLAMVQACQGDLAGARESMERAIEIESQCLAPDHPNWAYRYNNLAHICYAEEDRGAACGYFRKALEILLKHFDERHPHVIAVRRTMQQAGCEP